MARASSIQVHPPTEEIVIEAGLPETPGASALPAAAEGGRRTAEDATFVTAADAAEIDETCAPSDEAPTAAGSAVAEEARAAAGSAVAEDRLRDAGSGDRSRGGYEETTLEDLRSAKMSTTQKVVIVCAIVGIIVFIIWYLFNYIFI